MLSRQSNHLRQQPPGARPQGQPHTAVPERPHVPSCFGTAGSLALRATARLANRSPKGNSLRTTGSARSNCTGVAGLSSRANSAPSPV